jgi:hypothetical protein
MSYRRLLPIAVLSTMVLSSCMPSSHGTSPTGIPRQACAGLNFTIQSGDTIQDPCDVFDYIDSNKDSIISADEIATITGNNPLGYNPLEEYLNNALTHNYMSNESAYNFLEPLPSDEKQLLLMNGTDIDKGVQSLYDYIADKNPGDLASILVYDYKTTSPDSSQITLGELRTYRLPSEHRAAVMSKLKDTDPEVFKLYHEVFAMLDIIYGQHQDYDGPVSNL